MAGAAIRVGARHSTPTGRRYTWVRAGEPMTVKGIAETIMTERGLDKADRVLCRSMHKRVDMALRYQRTNGMVGEVEGDGVAVVWALIG
jgi:hypothetical protein